MALSDNLVSYWSLEETSGTRADAHGSNDLTDNNTVTSGTGIISTAADFEADNTESLSIADNTDLSTGNVSYAFSCWVNLESKGANRAILAKHDGASAAGSEYLLYYNSATDRFVFVVYSGSSEISVAASSFGSPSTGVWYHIVADHDATNDVIGIAVNGGTRDTQTTSGSAPNDTAASFSLGLAGASAFPFDGLIDEVAFRKGSIFSLAERAKLYNGGAGLSYAGLIAGGPDVYLVVCDGDSITEGFSANGYPFYLPDHLTPLHNVQNTGIGSQTLADMESTRTDVDGLYDTVFARNINVCFGGTNDIYFDASTATVQSRIQTYCESSALTGFTVAVCTLLPRGDFPGSSTLAGDAAAQEAEFESRRSTVNTWLRANWQTFADHLVDLAADSRMGDDGDEDDTTYYQADKVHPNNTGADVIAQLVAAQILLIAAPDSAYIVEPPAVDSVWQQYLASYAMPLAFTRDLDPPPPPPPPPPPATTPVISVIGPAWAELVDAWSSITVRPMEVSGPTVPTLPPVPLPQAGGVKPFVPRDPDAPPRLRPFMDKVSVILNSLMGRGEIVETEPREFALGGGFTATRNPGVSDDVTAGAIPGKLWVNTDAQTVWINVSNTQGAATWLQLSTS